MALNHEFVKIEENKTPASEHNFDCARDNLLLHCRSCTFQTSFLTQLKQHSQGLAQTNQAKLYRCNKCAFETHSCLIYVKHTYSDPNCNTHLKCLEDAKTKLTWFKCDLCHYKAKNKSSLKSHRYWKHKKNIQWFSCEQCSYQSRRKHDLKRHKLAKHTDPDIFNKGEKAAHYLTRDHPKSDTSPLKITWMYCKNCSYKTIDKSSYNKHVVRKHTSSESVSWFHCWQCPYRAKLEDNLRKHKKSQHTNPESIQWYQCEQCSYKTKRKRCLRYHQLAKHELLCDNNALKVSQWLQCGRCSYKTIHEHMLSQHRLKKHGTSHSVSSLYCEPYLCKGEAKFDMKMHQGVKPVTSNPIDWIQCSLCSFHTKSSSYLRAHTLRVHQMRFQTVSKK